MVECHVITLDRTVDNFYKQKPHLMNSGLIPKVFFGTDAKKGDHTKHDELLTPVCKNFCPDGLIGCGLSHILLAKKLFKQGTQLALILEDDAYPVHSDMNQEIQKVISETPRDWDIIKLHCDFCTDNDSDPIGGSAAAYIPKLKQVFDGITIRDHGLHASEGRMTLPLMDECSSGLLEIQTHFFEFLPMTEVGSASPVVLEAHELEVGVEYYILLTTSSGLYRYNIRDVVRCTGFYGTTPLLEFRHKGAHISSITGEKLAESQVVEAVNAAVRECGVNLELFTLTPQWGEPPGYKLCVQCDSADAGHNPARLNRFAMVVEEHLARLNVEYKDKRESGRLAPLYVQALQQEHWDAFTKNRQSRSGGSLEQYKHPCLLPDPEFQNLFGCTPETL